MATKAKIPAKPVKKAAPAAKAPAKPAAKTAKAPAGKKAAAAPAKKAAPAPAKKAAPVKKAAPAKKAVVTAKAPSKKTTPVPTKKATNTPVKPATKKAAAPAKKAAPAKAAPAKKVAVPAKKAAPVKAAAPPKKAAAPAKPAAKAPVKAAAPAKPAAKAPVKVAAPAVKPAPAAKVPAVKAPIEKPAPAAKAPKAKKEKAPVQRFITAPKPIVTPKPAPNAFLPKENAKPGLVVAHRRLENKAKDADTGMTMINYQPEFTRSILDTTADEPKGPVYRYSDEELNEFKTLINNRLESARRELAYLQGLITRKDEAGTEDTENRYMNMEDGSGAMEREQLAQMASRQIQFIGHLEKALTRIENKTYGICRVTGKLIDKNRLRAVPHATLSMEAKTNMNKK